MDLISPKVAYASVDSFIASVNTQIINPLILLLFALALAYFLYGLFIFIANGANDEKKTTGKEHMFWGVIGLTVMMGVWFLLGLILDTFNIPRSQVDPEKGTVNLPDVSSVTPVDVGVSSVISPSNLNPVSPNPESPGGNGSGLVHNPDLLTNLNPPVTTPTPTPSGRRGRLASDGNSNDNNGNPQIITSYYLGKKTNSIVDPVIKTGDPDPSVFVVAGKDFSNYEFPTPIIEVKNSKDASYNFDLAGGFHPVGDYVGNYTLPTSTGCQDGGCVYSYQSVGIPINRLNYRDEHGDPAPSDWTIRVGRKEGDSTVWSNAITVHTYFPVCGLPKLSNIVQDSVKISLNSEYVKITEKERKFTPKAPYSIYDIIDVAIEVDNKNCPLPDTNILFSSAAEVVIDGKSKKVNDLDPKNLEGVFTLVSKSGNRGVYRVKFSFSQNVIAQEKLVEATEKKEPINFIISDPTRPKYTPVKFPIEMTNCVQTYGTGQHKVVGMYGGSQLLSAHRAFFDSIRESGFAKIEPYASNQDKFSYFIDLKANKGKPDPVGDIIKLRESLLDGDMTVALHSVLSQYFSDVSCKNGVYLLHGTFNTPGISTYGDGSIKGALIDETLSRKAIAAREGQGNIALVYVHEFSHAFAGLNDEYLYKKIMDYKIPLKNCSTNPAVDYLYQKVPYGSTSYKGCILLKFGDGSKGTKIVEYFRPSDRSLMNGGNKISDQFNTVSCGHIMFAIKGGDPKSYFLYCNNLPGIIKHPSGRAAQASASDALDTTTRTDVGDTNSSVGSGGGFLIVESFDPNDQWGTIIPIIPDGVDISLSTPNTPLNITTGIPVSLGSITLTPTGDTFGVNNLAFEPTITTVDTVGTGNGFLDSISSIGLYDSSGNLVSSRDESVKDSILFKGPLTVSKTETYTIRGTLSPAFAIGQTITLTFDPSKNNTTFTAIKYNQSIPVATTILKLGTITVVSPPTPDISLWQKFLNWFGF